MYRHKQVIVTYVTQSGVPRLVKSKYNLHILKLLKNRVAVAETRPNTDLSCKHAQTVCNMSLYSLSC